MEVYHPSAISTSNGNLLITATKTPRTSAFSGRTLPYTSGLLTTGGIDGESAPGFTFRYGYAEARIKVADGQGIWPAFWTLPASYDDGDGEIDIMEYIGSEPNRYYTYYHGPNDTDVGDGIDVGVNLSDDFHVYAVDWRAGSIKWYLDGKEVFSTTRNVIAAPSYLLLNVAVGGDWPGAPDSTTQFPATMQVDYVRVWQ